jgi:hypothetical protein
MYKSKSFNFRITKNNEFYIWNNDHYTSVSKETILKLLKEDLENIQKDIDFIEKM